MQPEPTPRDEILRAARRAGLSLPPAYEDELVEAHAHILALVAALPRPAGRHAEPAHVFDPARFPP